MSIEQRPRKDLTSPTSPIFLQAQQSCANPNNGFLNTSPYTLQDSQFAGSGFYQNSTATPNTGSIPTIFDDTNTLPTSMTTPSSFSSGQSPRLIDLLLPGTDLNAPPPDYKDYRPRQSDEPYTPGGYQPTDPDITEEEEIEEVIRQSNPASAEAWIMRLPSPSPSTSSSSSNGSRFDFTNSIYNQPKLHAGSPEMLMLGFDRETCGILSVKDGPTENPWRTLVWPLARDSPALYHAISSMTAFHTSKLKPQMKVEGMEHMRRSIQYLAKGIENMRTETALATTLVLAFSESWDVHVTTGIEHLRGARILVKQALTKQNQAYLTGSNPPPSEETSRIKFLCNTWVYMDVIARLTNLDGDQSNDFDCALWSPPGPLLASTEVDPLMGCASTLFPLIGRVANLVRKVRTFPSNTMTIISDANDLKTAIESWRPPSVFEEPEDPTSDIQHSLQTAEAYRWATLLYLHQAVPEIPSLSASVLAKKALMYLATVPLSSRAVIVHIYPLLAAGCDAQDAEDRIWVENRWKAMSSRMLIGNIDRCWEVVKEVWDRRDSYELEVAEDDGWSLDQATAVTGQKQSPNRSQRRTASKGVISADGLHAEPVQSPVQNMKRAYTAEEAENLGSFMGWEDAVNGGGKRRATEGTVLGVPIPSPVRPGYSRIQPLEIGTGSLIFEKTVRGRLHWVGVMKDWNWEGMFSPTFIECVIGVDLPANIHDAVLLG